jgi:RNA polymerase sigma-70 factor (ECF subfamily)
LETDSRQQDQKILRLISQPETFQQGFRLLVNTYSERLYWQVRKMVFNHDDADDILQNAFVKVYRSIHRFKGESKLYTWLYRIATNEAITYINKRKRHSVASIDSEESHIAHTLASPEYFDGNEAERLLQLALATLPPKQRQVFNLRYQDEMSYKDMSELLGTSIGALKASYHHAIKKIEDFIRQH